MNEQKKLFWETISILNEANALPHILVIGSWVEYLYESYFDNFTSQLKTMDIDFLIKNKNKPAQPINIPKIMADNDYIQSIDGWGVMRYSKNALLEVEFLLRELGQGKNEPYEVKSFNLRVEGLRHMDILINNEISLSKDGYEIYMPRPSAYVLHKMIIHDKRKASKKEKDKASIKNILEFIANNKIEYGNLKRIYNKGLSKNEQKKANRFIEDNLIEIEFTSLC